MAAEPILEPIIEPVVIEPVLELVPDWVPQPDVPAPYYGPTSEPHWRDVFDWIKEHAILPAGRPIGNPYADEVQAQIDATTGAILKSLSGFINQAVQLEVENFNALSNALDTANAARVSDFNLLIGQTVQANQRLANLEHVVVPALLQAIAEADQRAQVRILQSEERTQHWVQQSIAQPLLETIFDYRAQAEHRADVQHVEAIDHANQLNASTLLHVAGEIGPIALAQRALQQWQDECGTPMCDTMGPKTDLGKLLKGLKIAALAAVLAELAALDENGLESLLRGLQHLSAGVIDTFTELFVGSGDTLGSTIAHTGA